MDKRGQYTFYRSFWEAIKVLPKKDRLPIYEAITEYALDGTIPSGLTQSQSAFFSLVKPNLDAARKKAANGKQGGSKQKANGKQKGSEKEKEIEIEKENEIEIEEEKEKEQSASELAHSFVLFWESYPCQIGKDEAINAWDAVVTDVNAANQILVNLELWKASEQWQDKGGRFIPRAAKFLRDGYWKNKPKTDAPTGRTLDSDEMAAVRRMMKGEVE